MRKYMLRWPISPCTSKQTKIENDLLCRRKYRNNKPAQWANYDSVVWFVASVIQENDQLSTNRPVSQGYLPNAIPFSIYVVNVKRVVLCCILASNRAYSANRTVASPVDADGMQIAVSVCTACERIPKKPIGRPVLAAERGGLLEPCVCSFGALCVRLYFLCVLCRRSFRIN